MRCAQYREALSAQLDGEALGMPAATLGQHLRRCPACAGWQESVVRATRRARVGPAAPVPDLSRPILAAVAAVRPRRSRLLVGLRVALVAVALGQAAVGWSALVLGTATLPAPAHVVHESGAWNLALAVALLAVARRPQYAAGTLPALAAFVAVLAVVGLPDLAAGAVRAGQVAVHLLVVAGLGLVAAVARLRRPGWMPPVGSREASGRAVPDGLAGQPNASTGMAGASAGAPARASTKASSGASSEASTGPGWRAAGRDAGQRVVA